MLGTQGGTHHVVVEEATCCMHGPAVLAAGTQLPAHLAPPLHRGSEQGSIMGWGQQGSGKLVLATCQTEPPADPRPSSAATSASRAEALSSRGSGWDSTLRPR